MNSAPSNYIAWVQESVQSECHEELQLVRSDIPSVSQGLSPEVEEKLSASHDSSQSILRNHFTLLRGRRSSSRRCLPPPSNSNQVASRNVPISQEDSFRRQQTWAESHSQKIHGTALNLIMCGQRHDNSSPAERGLIGILRSSTLLPVAHGDTGNCQNTMTALGLTFCMSNTARQWWLLLWSVISATLHHFAISEGQNKNEGVIGDIIGKTRKVIQIISRANPGVCFRVPVVSGSNTISAVARHLVNWLSLAGLCFPFKRLGEELFCVSPFLQLAVSDLGDTYHANTHQHSLGGPNGPSHQFTLPPDITATVQTENRCRTAQKRPRSPSTEVCDNRFLITHFTTRSQSGVWKSKQLVVVGSNRPQECIVSETNFRLYVYSTAAIGADWSASPLLRIVAQFADHDLTIPHRRFFSGKNGGGSTIETFSVFRLTRPAFARAHQRGITAAQINQFLALKSHPSASNGVPLSVQDQLRMWQDTCERVRWTDTASPIVSLTFDDENTLARVVGLGVNVLHRCGLQVLMHYDDFVRVSAE